MGASIALGNFDGVHRGHKVVIAAAARAALALDIPLGVATFDPHPRRFFQPDAPVFCLTKPKTTARRLTKLDVSRIYTLPFNSAMAQMSPETFATDILVKQLGIRHVAVGADFRFGARRTGDAEILQALGVQYGFGVTVVSSQTERGQTFSSTAIRNALALGDPTEAARQLGDWHVIEGRVEQGDQRGRELGFPTANLSMDGLTPIAHGIYAVMVEILDGPHMSVYTGVSSAGTRPTFGENQPNFETYLFDFTGDLYGAEIAVSLVAWLRPEQKFTSIDALIDQIKQDCQDAKQCLETIIHPWEII